MAKLPSNRPGRFLYESDEFQDITVNQQKIVDGDVFEYENDVGDKFIFKKYEIKDVIREFVDEAIGHSKINLHIEFEEKITKDISGYLKRLEKDLLTQFYDKVDEVAEKMAVETLEFRIEEEVQKRLDIKLKEIERLIKGDE